MDVSGLKVLGQTSCFYGEVKCQYLWYSLEFYVWEQQQPLLQGTGRQEKKRKQNNRKKAGIQKSIAAFLYSRLFLPVI